MNEYEQLLPPHANAETHRRVMAALEAATPAEHRAMLIAAGIMTPSGELAEHYRVRQPSRQKAPLRGRGRAKPRTVRARQGRSRR